MLVLLFTVELMTSADREREGRFDRSSTEKHQWRFNLCSLIQGMYLLSGVFGGGHWTMSPFQPTTKFLACNIMARNGIAAVQSKAVYFIHYTEMHHKSWTVQNDSDTNGLIRH